MDNPNELRLNKFRAGNGQRLLRGLFRETQVPGTDSAPVYTLRDYDNNGLQSLYRLYMELEDVTEWDFAQEYLDGWDHWETLCNCTWFKDHVARWRKELNLKLAAKRIKAIIANAENPASKTSFAANKYLVEKGWLPAEERRRGRPSKEEVKAELQKQTEEALRLDEDLSRITQKEYAVVNGR